MRLLAVFAAALFVLVVMTVVVSALTSPLSALTVLTVAALAFLGWRLLGRRVRRGTTLEIDLDNGVVEKPPSGPLERMLHQRAVVLRDVTDALDRAREDDRVTAVVVRLGNGGVGLAQAQEVREAVARFRASGKRAIAYAETFGEMGRGTIDYYLATAFEEIHLQPLGMVSIEGLVSRTPFLRGLLDRLGMTPDFDHRREYKTAMYLLTEKEFVEPHEEMARAILEDQMAQIVAGIAADRRLEPDRVRHLIDNAPLLGVEALEAGLVDELSYRDQAYRAAGEDGHFMYHHRYLKRAGRPHRKGQRIGLVYGTGIIVRGSSGLDPLSRGATLGAEDVARAIREAGDDEKVKALVFRVDSPGGSAVASEVVRREVARAREAGKPVVVSLGDVAGSGGYWIAAPASRIVAQPGTVTGSIGVVAGKLAPDAAWQKVGVNWGELHEGRNAGFAVPLQPYTDTERERLEAILDSVYEDFKQRVADGRLLAVDDVEEVAKGRVWTGAQAAERGLVDELGGLHRALQLARDEAGIAPDAFIQVRVFPARRAIPLPKREEGSDPVSALLGLAVSLARALAGLAGGPSVEVRMGAPRR
ncbi:MAG: signal peptide peptidase SppA [Actinobacteria bacterium]|nr:signal peptide peptidase SppA [Actinomycetota bacterium]